MIYSEDKKSDLEFLKTLLEHVEILIRLYAKTKEHTFLEDFKQVGNHISKLKNKLKNHIYTDTSIEYVIHTT